MSQRRRLPNSLRWRAVGWMEMGLSQADAATRLNVSRSVVQRLWDQYQSEDSVSRRPVPGQPRATTPAEDRFLALSARRRRTTTVPQLVADHFQASGRRISATTRRNRLCWAREHVSWTQQQWASVLFTDESRFTMESDSGRLLIWREQRTRYHQSNTVERHSYRGGGILVWAGISLGGHTDLHVFHGGTVTGLRYRDEILDPYVRPYAAAIGNDFILMDDNARPHRARIFEEYLEDDGLERMEWPARFPDLNPIEHLWVYLGREVAALNPLPRSLHELKQGLLCVWSSLLIPVSDNLINSMEIDAANAFKENTLGWPGASHLSSLFTSHKRGLATRQLFREPPRRKGTIHLQTSMSSPGFEPSPYDTAVSVSNHYTHWAESVSKPDEIRYVTEELVNLAMHINLEVDSDDIQELLDFHNQELTIDELIEMQEQEQDIEELNTLSTT
ncbi:transposable element Tcb2 transposase [Trichonephila clavipes]|uniref:Transposable element Tcb2 transposase n=1 Tax=Trichonephila clavipes TaxID=2585209 RepID=A0A8X6RZV2_TRICX|nr:transposable element Tcb2 transposase [Trichonephila clavipes]